MAGSKMSGPAERLSRRAMKILILFALPSLLLAEECDQGVTYLDPVTGNCDPCNDICDHSLEQGTQARCDRLCKGYKVVSDQCPSGQYFDKNLGRCDYCSTICLHQQDDCASLCPDWTTSTEKPLVTPDIDFTADHSPTPARHIGQNSDENSGNKIHTFILIGIGILAVVIVAVICFTLRKPLAKKIKSFTVGRCSRRAIQEQQGTNTPMLRTDTPIVRNGTGPFTQPMEEKV